MSRTVIFVYNAKSDVWSKSLDLAHKMLSPSTYNCDLCALTHGNFSEKKIWKNFKENSDVGFVFIYKDAFVKKYSNLDKYVFPIILELQDDNDPIILFDAQKLASIGSIEEFIKKLKKEILTKKF
ncbi:GTPase [Aquimarina sp. AU474]|uniref:GTPase n=1 Tax=Aquimarina sp. AU474 TaxID=2108529 RepID=UPI000D686EEC|nr:GTPase [Aquimarina sp. AU474]